MMIQHNVWRPLIGIWVLSLTMLGPIARGESQLAVTSSQDVHPVLIRNDQNPVVRVVIDVPEEGVALQSMRFTLDGTDDPADVEQWELFATGPQTEFSPVERCGEPRASAAGIEFQNGRPLVAGKNVFWLSCRLRPDADLAHRVGAVCREVRTTAATLVPENLTPGRSHRVGVALRKHNDGGVHTYRIPALTTTARGTLLAVYDMRRRAGRDLQEDIDIGLSRSTDGGRTWEPARVIMDMGEYGGLPQEQNGCSDPGIIVDLQTGEIFCFAVWMNGKPGKHQWNGDGSEPGYEIGKSAQFLMVRSRDDGLTWSPPENLTRKLKRETWWLFAPSPQQGIQLSDGTLVMPSQGRDDDGREFSTIMVSRDHGANWTVGTPAYSGGSECQVAQLGDGSLMLNMRNERERFRAVAITRDLGRSWEEHSTSRRTLIEPNCNGSLLRVDYEQSGERRHLLLFANPHSQTARTHQTIQLSFDDGQTWPAAHQYLLDEGRGRGYPSLTRIDDQHIGIVYEGSQADLVFEKLAIRELLDPAAGRPAALNPPYVWERVAASAAFAPRDGAGALVFAGKMWLLGGWNPLPAHREFFPRICNNEVWSSETGAEWTLVKPNTFHDAAFDSAADWEGRHTAGYAVYRDRMWIVGGDCNQGHYQNDVWTSTDGRSWQCVNLGQPPPWKDRALHYTVVHDDKIWVMGGQTMPAFAAAEEVFHRDIWTTTDGVQWTRVVPSEPCWSARGMIGGAAVKDGRIWILGGGTYDTPQTPARKYYNDVWSSSDGVHWTRHTEAAPWHPRQYHEVAVWDGLLWVLEGYHQHGGNRQDVWYSADGETWTELPATPWKPRHAASVFVFQDSLWLVAGNNMESDVWRLRRNEGPAAK